jgi:hypothetical protein
MNPASNNLYMKRGHAVEIRALSLATIFREQQIDRCKFFKIACALHKPVYYGITDPAHTPQKLWSSWSRRASPSIGSRSTPTWA